MPSPHIHIPFTKISEYIDFINKNRLNLEIYFSADTLDTVTFAGLSSMKKALSYNPSLSIHAPFMDLSPGAVDSKVRKATMDRFFYLLDLSVDLDPVCIVFHSGYEKWKYALNIDLWLEKSLLTWNQINRTASDMGVKIAIENIFEEEPTNLKLLMENMNSDNFGICFDTGHCNLFSKVPLEVWMDALNPYILELHLHDNNKNADQHLPIGEGTFDFRQFFNLLSNKDCVYTLEAHSLDHATKSMEALNRYKDLI